jgi:glycosyltransferase involved in cell wall biosynthesis
MPVLATATPVYRRVMDSAGLPMTCATAAEWGEQFERLLGADTATLEAIGRQGRAFANRAYSKEEFVARFDRAFESIGFST